MPEPPFEAVYSWRGALSVRIGDDCSRRPTEVVPGIATSGYPYVGKFGSSTVNDGYFASCFAMGDRYVLTAYPNVGSGGDTDFQVMLEGVEYDSVNVKP